MPIRDWGTVDSPVKVLHIETNPKIGRISIDGEVNGLGVAVVFMDSEVPSSVKTLAQMTKYMETRLREEAKRLEAEAQARRDAEAVAAEDRG